MENENDPNGRQPFNPEKWLADAAEGNHLLDFSALSEDELRTLLTHTGNMAVDSRTFLTHQAHRDLPRRVQEFSNRQRELNLVTAIVDEVSLTVRDWNFMASDPTKPPPNIQQEIAAARLEVQALQLTHDKLVHDYRKVRPGQLDEHSARNRSANWLQRN